MHVEDNLYNNQCIIVFQQRAILLVVEGFTGHDYIPKEGHYPNDKMPRTQPQSTPSVPASNLSAGISIQFVRRRFGVWRQTCMETASILNTCMTFKGSSFHPGVLITVIGHVRNAEHASLNVIRVSSTL